MSHPAVIKASALIHAGDISAAESALTELVETEGDHVGMGLVHGPFLGGEGPCPLDGAGTGRFAEQTLEYAMDQRTDERRRPGRVGQAHHKSRGRHPGVGACGKGGLISRRISGAPARRDTCPRTPLSRGSRAPAGPWPRFASVVRRHFRF